MLIHLNGQMIPHDQARIHVDDAGLQHAVGLFETLAVRQGRAFRLQAHLERLAQSAQQLGLARELDLPSLAEAVRQTIAENQLTEARVRLTVTAGEISLLRPRPQSEAVPLTTLVIATPPTAFDPAAFEKGVTALIAPPLANPFDPLAGHKTLAYWSRLRVLRQSAAAGAAEAIVLNVTNHLAGGTVSNLFLVRDGELLTPFARDEEVSGALPAPVLPGVTRAAVIELAAQQNLTVHRRMLSVDDLLSADEVFLTNSNWFILPVTHIEKQPIASGAPGAITQSLRAALLEQLHRETAAD